MRTAKIIKVLNFLIILFTSLLLIASTFSKAALETFSTLVILFWLVKRSLIFKKEGKFFPATVLNRPIAGYALVILLATINSVNFKSSIIAFFGKTLEYILLYFAVCDTVKTKKTFYLILLGLILAGGGLVIDSAFQYFTGTDLFRHYQMNDDFRLKASFSNANDFAGWLILITPLFILLILSRLRNKSFLSAFGLGSLSLLMLVCLWLTFSKAAILGLFIALIFLTVYFSRKKKRAVFFVIAALIFFAVFSFLKGWPQEFINTDRSASVLLRIDLWKTALSAWADYPLLGSGPSTYVQIIPFYNTGWQLNTSYPHNSFLHMSVETGLAGLCVFIWVIFELFSSIAVKLRAGISHQPEIVGLAAGIGVFLFQSFFDTNLYAVQLVIPFWIFIGLCSALCNDAA